MKAGRLTALVGIVTLVFLVMPILIVVGMSFSSASSLQFPPPGLSLRWYRSFFGDPRWVEALVTSTMLAFASSIVALVLGSAAAYGIVRGRFPGRGFIDANFMAPLIVPTIVVAVAMYRRWPRSACSAPGSVWSPAMSCCRCRSWCWWSVSRSVRSTSGSSRWPSRSAPRACRR